MKFGINDQSLGDSNPFDGIQTVLTPVAMDDFEVYAAREFPGDGGWLNAKEIFTNCPVENMLKDKENLYLIDYRGSASGGKSFGLKSNHGQPVVVAKNFSLPERILCGISNGNFKIEEEKLKRNQEKRKQDSIFREPSKSASSRAQDKPGNPNTMSLIDTTCADSYYIYSFDGKLMAEYNNDGACVRDYIYVGNRLLAEYRPQENKYYYYISDQVNSTRMITDDAGAAVYSATFDPYGGLQKTWVSSYTPALKFSGKEREASTDMDYFGARYYDHMKYRFLTSDPVINKEEAMSNPQLWNLYAFCRNNPVTFMELDGRTDVNINVVRKYFGKTAIIGDFYIQGTEISGVTLERTWKDNIKDESCILCGSYSAQIEFYQGKKRPYDRLRLFDVEGREDVLLHPGNIWKETKACILPGKTADYEKETIFGSAAKLKEMTDLIRAVQFIDFFILKEPTNIRVNVSVDMNMINFVSQFLRF